MVAKLLDNIRQNEAQKIAAATTAYGELVEAVHAGREVDPDAAVGILDRAGKTAADLESDCQRLAEILRLETIVAGEAEFNRRLVANAERKKALDDEMARVRAEWDRRSDELFREDTLLRGQLAEIGAARSRLSGFKFAWRQRSGR